MHPNLRPLLARAVLPLAAFACGLAPATSLPLSPPRPSDDVVRIRVADARTPIRVASVDSVTHIAGPLAHTRVSLELRNPNARVLEGELQFPLQPGQEVTGFALDIDGELRPAVAVPKAKGRQVFEDVVRGRVDPALLEATGGRNYKLRVYPLPANGSRRVVLDIAERLPAAGRAYSFQLPLRFDANVERWQAAVHVQATATPAVSARLGAERLRVETDGQGNAKVVATRKNWAGSGALRVDVRQAPRMNLVTTGVWRDEHYFYAEIAHEGKARPRPAPKKVALLWDASGSGARRDHAGEFALLERWFQAVPTVEVDLVFLRDVAQAPTPFTVRGADWRALRQALEAVVYDGATRLDGWTLAPDVGEALLFSDGLANWGDTASVSKGSVTLHTIGSGAGSNATRLRQMAEASGGAYVDLSAGTVVESVQALRMRRTRVLGLRSSSATDLVAGSAFLDSGRLLIAGKLKAARTRIDVDLEDADGKPFTRSVDIEQLQAAEIASPIAPLQWASFSLARLEADAELNSSAIRRLGLHFALATRETSLIVLDNVADYVRHDIEPPDALRAQFDKLRSAGQSAAATRRANHLAATVRAFEAKQAWWEKEFPKDAPPPPPPRPAPVQNAAIVQSAPAPSAPAPAPVAAAAMPADRSSAERQRADTRPNAAAAAAAAATPATATIQLRKWEPDAVYARRLKAAAPDAMYAVYLDERPGYLSSSAFFIDAADIFIERGQLALGLRILSNLAEMDLENRHLLRILGYRLVQAGAVQAAIPVLRKVQRLAPDEPQSWRDLALALAAAGQRQEAVGLLAHVAQSEWAPRFPDIALIALAEMNALLARQTAEGGAALDVAAIDPRFIKNMPLDVRVVLTWDADNTDIDLHVIDPNGEEVYYGRPLSYQGGRVSKDFTGGFGPEEFSLRHAKPGVYTVKARFYGHRQQVVAPATTLMLWLSTGFGTPAQVDRSTVLRLAGSGDMVTVGTFTVDAQ